MNNAGNIAACETALNYVFSNKPLLLCALTHPSSTRDRIGQSYERLEFLGDNIINLLTAEALYHAYADEAEGALAKRRSALVCRESIAAICRDMEMADFIVLGVGEERSGGRDHDANLENMLEAIAGAVYLDGGLKAADLVFSPYINPLVQQMVEAPSDPKTTLQEWAQGRGLALPKYQVVRQAGPAHAPEFEIEVNVQGFEPVTGLGSNKKQAEQEAATKLLEVIGG